MLPRPYQKRLVERAKAALGRHGDTLAVAATGAGKTICLSFLGKEMGGRQLVLQHRQELVDQNIRKYRAVNQSVRLGLFTADAKSWRGDVTFAMAQTLARNLKTIPKLDLLIIDEAHHVAAATWRNIIAEARDRNPDIKIAGFTATPERGDKKSLRAVFSNVCDQVTIRELVQLGFLVPPKAFVVDVAGTQDRLREIGKVSDYFDQAEVEKILNTVAVNAEVVRHWRDKAGDRPTIVFCSTVHHAQDVAAAFRAEGVAAECVHGAMPDAQRQAVLQRLARGQIQVVTNVMVLTEGFDCPPVSAVVLLRKCSEKGPLVQMVGRGLRTVNPEEHPGVVKKDCVVLDFGTSLLTHGDLDVSANLAEEREVVEGEALTKLCPTSQDQTDSYRVPDSAGRVGCGAELPAQTKTCPLCGFSFERQEDDGDGSTVTSVELTELQILEASPFRYVDLFDSGRAMMASGFEAWAGVFSPDGDTWFALGKLKNEARVHRIAVTGRLQAMAAADDFLRQHETDGAAKKTKRWLDEPASPKQVELLNRFGYDLATDLLGQSNMTKYGAACHANFQFVRTQIENVLGVAA